MNSQVVEVGIGLALTFFVMALIASGVAEVISTLMKKRATDLGKTIDGMLGSADLAGLLRDTSVYKALEVGAGGGANNTAPSHMSGRAFADATIEMLAKKKRDLENTGQTGQELITLIEKGPIGDRLLAISAEVGSDVTAARARLESWFDEIMERLQEAYTRWARWILFGIATALAIGLNISATHITSRLWNDSAVRQAVVDSASEVIADPNAANKLESIDQVVEKIEGLDALRLPMGWKVGEQDVLGWLLIALGWPLIGVASMLGAQFWFDILKRLSALRGGGGRPAPAGEDPLSASFQIARFEAGRPPATPTAVPAADKLWDLIPSLRPRTDSGDHPAG